MLLTESAQDIYNSQCVHFANANHLHQLVEELVSADKPCARRHLTQGACNARGSQTCVAFMGFCTLCHMIDSLCRALREPYAVNIRHTNFRCTHEMLYALLCARQLLSRPSYAVRFIVRHDDLQTIRYMLPVRLPRTFPPKKILCLLSAMTVKGAHTLRLSLYMSTAVRSQLTRMHIPGHLPCTLSRSLHHN